MRESCQVRLDWLRYEAEPYLRARTLRDVLGRAADDRETAIARAEIPATGLARTLLAERGADGSLPCHPAARWRGALWVLANLADLAYPEGDRHLLSLCQQVETWLTTGTPSAPWWDRALDRERRRPAVVGLAAWTQILLGWSEGATVGWLEQLRRRQGEDGTWAPLGQPASGHRGLAETLWPLRALALYSRRTGHQTSAAAAGRAAEAILAAGVANPTGPPTAFTRSHFPTYDRADLLLTLCVLREAGLAGDPRAAGGLAWLAARQVRDGGFPVEARHYGVGREHRRGSLVDWGTCRRGVSNPWITVCAYQVLGVGSPSPTRPALSP